MAHSLIIQLSRKRIPKKEYLSIFDLTEDPVFHSHADWGGAEGNLDDCLDDIAKKLSPVMFTNRRKKALTFKSKGTISAIIRKNLFRVYRSVRGALTKDAPGIRCHSSIVTNIESADITEYLFYYEDRDSNLVRCHTLSEMLFDYLNGRIKKTLYIGGILDYHF